MPDEPEHEEPKQETPAGAEIPIPNRDEVLRDLRKVAKPLRGNGNGGAEDQGEEHRPT